MSFTPGSVSLSAWGLTPAGYKWGAENKDTTSDQPQGFSTNMGEKGQLLLSDKIRGYFLVPPRIMCGTIAPWAAHSVVRKNLERSEQHPLAI